MPLFDLHSHFSFKPANSRAFGDNAIPDPDHWRERFKRKSDWRPLVAALDKEVVKSSQLHGDAATAGGFRVIVNGLYPLEHGFTSKLLNGSLAMLTGFAKEVLDELYEHRRSYFSYLEREYHNLIAGQRLTRFSARGNRYKVVDSYSELEAAHQADPDTICIVNSIEGAHAFADLLRDKQGRPIDVHHEEARFVRRTGVRGRDSWFELHIEALLANIDRVKTNWEHTPLFVTFAHHYYNHLCGIAPSLTHLVAITNPQQGGAPREQGYDTRYFDLGIRRWGRKVLARLIDRRSGSDHPVRRILIDTKHMSPQARLEYYEIVDQRRKYFNDQIPIVASHTAVNGRKSLRRTIENNRSSGSDFDLHPDDQGGHGYFYNGVIGLFDDEIERIVASDGIIGMMIDERRIIGQALPPEAGLAKARFDEITQQNRAHMRAWTRAKQRHAWGELSDAALAQELALIDAAAKPLLDELRPAYLSVIFRQLFHIVSLPGVGRKGWDHVALGTDYDGVINPIDIYRQSSDMRTLKDDLVSFWKDRLIDPGARVRDLYASALFGERPEHWIEKLLWSNGMDFLRKYFNDDYLLHGQPVT
jgi:hypothetical protein